MTFARTRVAGAHQVVPVALLVIAILAISSSAVLVRWAEAPAVSLSFWRTAVGALVLAPMARWSATPGPRSAHAGSSPAIPWGPIVLAGLALAVHFATWLASLELTSVGASVTLVSTAPIFLAGWLAATGRRPPPRALLATALAIAGTVVITGGDALADDQSLVGDALALVGAAAMAVYLVAGARVREQLSTTAYASRAYLVAAAALLPVALLTGQPLAGYDGGTWLAIAAMVLGPQLAGHTLFNHLLGRLGAVTVALALLVEPAGAAALTWMALGEVPTLAVAIGAPIVIAGLALQVLGNRPQDDERAARSSS